MNSDYQNQPVDVTVAVMSYNNARFIGQTIDSILAQEGVAFELKVFDDCSTDDSVKVLDRYVDDPRFHYEINEKNLGLNGNYNRCLRSGQGRYVVVLGSDDVLYPDHIRSLCAAMDAAPQAMLGYVQCNWIDESGELIRRAVHPGHRDASYAGGRNEIAGLLSYDNYITPSAAILRRSMLDTVALPDGTLARDHLLAQDWDLWLRIAAVHPDFVFLCQATVGYRIHGGQISQKFYADARPLLEHTEILERCLIDAATAPRIREAALPIWRLYQSRQNAYPEAARKTLAARAGNVRRQLLGPMTGPLEEAGPLFSVIVTTYNRPGLLRDALSSLAAQTFRDFEVILVNDHGEPVEQLLDGCELPLIYFNQPSNQGLSAARNAGLKRARGRYVAYLDDDDIYLSDHLECLAQAFESHPDTLVYTDVVYVQERLENDARIEVGRSFPTAHDAFDRDKLFIQNYIPVNTWAHPRMAVAEVGNFDTELTAFEDWDMLLRLAQRYPVHRIPRVTAEVRQRVSGGADHMLARERDRLLPLYRKLYARYPEAGNDRVQTGRQIVLAGQAPREKPWGVPEWLADRSPSSSRVLAVRTLLQANPDVGTLGVVVIVPTGAGLQSLVGTLESLGAQHRPVDGVWLIGHGIPDEAAGNGIEILHTDVHWAKRLSERIDQGGMPDFLWILYAGDRLVPHATLTMGEYRLRKPDPLVWYADEAVLEADAPANPMLKPDFNVDLLRSYPYIGRSPVISTAAIQAAGGMDERVADLAPVDLIWRLVEQVGPPVVAHVPEVLQLGGRSLMEWVRDPETMTWFPAVTQAHFVRMGLEARVEPGVSPGLQRVEYPLAAQPLVSIIIPTRDQLPVLRACVEGLMEHTAYPHYELLIVDNGSVEPDAVAFLAGLEGMGADRVRVLRWPQAFDFATINNFAAGQARGDVLLFLNNDIQFASRARPDWLERLLRHALRPEVGMAGSRLDLPDGGVEQCGQVLGMDESVGAAFRGLPSDRQGYMNRLTVQQNVSALSAACLMMRREVFDELGGFDAESFPVYYADTDLCLKATQAGYLLVLEPDTGLLHMGGATRLLTEKFGLETSPDDEQRDRLYHRWLPQLARDPNYHPALGRHSPGFDLSTDASRIQEPLPGRPLPVVLAAHADWQGCGHYRILHPFRAMGAELRLEGGLKHGDFHFTDVARIQPDVIVLQGAWLNEGILTQIRRYREITGAKVVLEFDDYLPNIPTRSIYRKKLPQGVIKNMRRAIEQVDWLVVSTPTLAQEYMDYHADIRVALNGLPADPWRGLVSERRTGRKMRVGWAGGVSHTGDLAEIRAVVQDLQGEVEWVFMGMKPQDVSCEYHPGVAIDRYPEKLASLNLDLAVVPLEINQFNRCKSNLRLLELGACGVPVIATAIEPYRGGLPVTLVRNRHQDWVEAIRAHLADPGALAEKGDALRDAVLQGWMLEGGFLDQWARAWGVAPESA
ncbi:glycosyltransferase [uncultured Castellaniella sp.]|uniref:glycosyltransferase n=1 Tax=uncultured Castellaniella sp. TaxID=647907 RepID=UPI00261DD5D6|nr:glycosyltransferase [uncultured Castellaniella sp.]